MNTTTEQSDFSHFLSESQFVCVEIGLAEIEGAAGHAASQIHLSDLTEVTVTAMRRRPAHVTDILLVSSWMFAEGLCTEAQRDVVRKHWLVIAQGIEDALS